MLKFLVFKNIKVSIYQCFYNHLLKSRIKYTTNILYKKYGVFLFMKKIILLYKHIIKMYGIANLFETKS